MEMNFMLAYGAAESSLCLLHRFRLLDIMLPVHVSGSSSSASPFTFVLIYIDKVEKFLN